MEKDKKVSYSEFRTLFVIKVKNTIDQEKTKLAKVKRKGEIAKRQKFITSCEKLLNELSTRVIKDSDLVANNKVFDKMKSEETLRKLMPLFTFLVILIVSVAILITVFVIKDYSNNL